MLRVLAIVLAVIVFAAGGIAAYAAITQPDTFRVTRSLDMAYHARGSRTLGLPHGRTSRPWHVSVRRRRCIAPLPPPGRGPG